jgi:DNA end-binding protein Ku
MRALWSGAISFGLVNIPVKMYSASESVSLDLDMLHKKDMEPIRYARVCKAEGKEVPFDEIVKGYQVEKGEYVVLTDEDFRHANARKTQAIEIAQFAAEAEIDPIYYEKPYYLVPEKSAEKPYVLLRDALAKSGKVAVARFVMHGREHVAAIRPENDALMLIQLRYASEIRRPEGLKFPAAKARGKEAEMAIALVERLTQEFRADDFTDTYVDELKRVIRMKAKGKTPKPRGKAPEPTRVTDLMSLLRESLETHQRGRAHASVSARS